MASATSSRSPPGRPTPWAAPPPIASSSRTTCAAGNTPRSASADGRWRVRDLSSLNGTRVNGVRLEGDRELAAHDEVHLGRTHLLFVEDMDQLPDLPRRAEDRPEGVAIKKRLGQTRFLTPVPAEAAVERPTRQTVRPPPRHALSRDLSLLYRLALDMGSAGNYEELCRIVLDALLEATPPRSAPSC